MERSIVAFSTRYQFGKAWSAQNSSSRRSALAKVTGNKALIKRITLVVLSLFVSLVPVATFAQSTSSTSSVTGIVSDINGSVIAGAEVKLTNTKTSRELVAKTDDQGVYRFSQVQPAQGYKLTVTSPGFQMLELENIS